MPMLAAVATTFEYGGDKMIEGSDGTQISVSAYTATSQDPFVRSRPRRSCCWCPMGQSGETRDYVSRKHIAGFCSVMPRLHDSKQHGDYLCLSGVNGLEVLSNAMPIIIDGEGEDVSRARRKGPTREANNIIRARA